MSKEVSPRWLPFGGHLFMISLALLGAGGAYSHGDNSSSMCWLLMAATLVLSGFAWDKLYKELK